MEGGTEERREAGREAGRERGWEEGSQGWRDRGKEYV